MLCIKTKDLIFSFFLSKAGEKHRCVHLDNDGFLSLAQCLLLTQNIAHAAQNFDPRHNDKTPQKTIRVFFPMPKQQRATPQRLQNLWYKSLSESPNSHQKCN